jgi:predicted metalloendopeptidase
MNDTAVLLGADPAKSQEDLKSALLLEIALANASAPREERRNSSLLYNPFILGELERLDGHPPSWTDYVASIFQPAVEITDKERIVVQNPAYLKKMAPILLAADRRTLANYVGWRAAVSAMSHLNREAKDIKQRYDKAIHGTNERTPTWKKCVREAGFNSFSGASFGIGISSMYVKRFFPAEAKTSMVNMISYLRKGFSSILDNIDWMDQATRGKAHEKLDQMIQFIAYPDELLDKSKVDGMFSELDIQEGDYLGNVLKLIKWYREFTNKRLRQPVDKKDWVDHSYVALVNAFYNPSVNSIEFPAGILQGAFFDHRVPAYLNFGAIGGVIGHEITHGFDDQGRQYDGEGNSHIVLFSWMPICNSGFP